MPGISFGNPVNGRIRPLGSPKIIGSFRVTAAFGQVDDTHTTPHIGLDIGNARCGDPILAMADGKVSFIQRSGGNPEVATIVRVQHDRFDDDVESGYAHLATIANGIALGGRVTRGQVIGTLGKTGTKRCHLHLGVKVDRIEVNGWPRLDQNQETDMLKGTHPARPFNRKGLILGDNTRFRTGPSIREGVLATYSKDTEIAPDFIVDGGSVGGSVKWYATWGNTGGGKEFGYIHVSTVGPLAPIEVVEDPIA